MRERFLDAVAANTICGDVLNVTLARIGAEFSVAAGINSYKMLAERVILFGPGHRATKARYHKRAQLLRSAQCDLNGAISFVKTWRAFRRHDNASAMLLRELHLILRWMRAQGMSCQFQSILDEVLR